MKWKLFDRVTSHLRTSVVALPQPRALERKARTVAPISVGQSILWSPVCRQNIAKYGYEDHLPLFGPNLAVPSPASTSPVERGLFY
jgi:hypothetical protein